VTDQEKAAKLAASTDMVPVQGTVDVDIPIETLWASFAHANFWPRWNNCFFWARNKDLVKGRHLIWTFQPIKPWLPYKMWAIANIVELVPQSKVTWEVTALPGFYARHTYHMEDLGNGRTRFGSWEQAMGWGFRLMSWFWLLHFPFVKDESLKGALRLEDQYKKTGMLDPGDMTKKSYVGFWVVVVLLLALLAALITGIVGYTKYGKVTSTDLAPGVRAFFGGGGNSLLVESEGRSLLVDTKFPPGSTSLHDLIAHHDTVPVDVLVNTHYHYDHTQGNSLYPSARKMAGSGAPALMHSYDDDWWSSHPDGVPTDLITGERTLQVGSVEVRLEPVGLPAHTSADVWVYLPQQNIIATGDLVFHTYYPFLDQPEGGTSIPGMVEAVRRLAQQHPDAVFLPGHGPLATAADLLHYADYLQAMQTAAVAAHAQGWTEDQAAQRNSLSTWGLSVLPSYHHHKLIWSTAANDARWAYVLAGEETTTEGKRL
jgi:glyoxylase-like metal-dependent hydrolase (beta-lactamase superfamily II)